MIGNEGLIACNHGHVKVLNRSRMENICCECYGVVRQEFTRLPGNTR